jgi:hypothetical protein
MTKWPNRHIYTMFKGELNLCRNALIVTFSHLVSFGMFKGAIN